MDECGQEEGAEKKKKQKTSLCIQLLSKSIENSIFI